jgi:hypothetical protein
MPGRSEMFGTHSTIFLSEIRHYASFTSSQREGLRGASEIAKML